jgi:hypothetical protein
MNSHLGILSEIKDEGNMWQPFDIDAGDISLLVSPQSSLLEFHYAYRGRVHYLDIIKGTGLEADTNSTIELKYTGMSDKSEEVWGRPKNSVSSLFHR